MRALLTGEPVPGMQLADMLCMYGQEHNRRSIDDQFDSVLLYCGLHHHTLSSARIGLLFS